MIAFQANDPSLESQWRALILFGKNSATYKFAFAKSLLEIVEKEKKEDPLLEKLKHIELSDNIIALSGVLKGKYPDDMDYKDMKYEYLKDKYGL